MQGEQAVQSQGWGIRAEIAPNFRSSLLDGVSVRALTCLLQAVVAVRSEPHPDRVLLRVGLPDTVPRYWRPLHLKETWCTLQMHSSGQPGSARPSQPPGCLATGAPGLRCRVGQGCRQRVVAVFCLLCPPRKDWQPKHSGVDRVCVRHTDVYNLAANAKTIYFLRVSQKHHSS